MCEIIHETGKTDIIEACPAGFDVALSSTRNYLICNKEKKIIRILDLPTWGRIY